MTKVYATYFDYDRNSSAVDWVRNDGMVLKVRPICEAYTVPTALVLLPPRHELESHTVIFCAERKTGSYEHMSHCDIVKRFASEAEAREYAANWQ